MKRCFGSLLFILCFFRGLALDPVIFSGNTPPFLIGKSTEWLEDKDGHLLITDVAKRNDFVASKLDVPNFGLTTSAYWLHFILQNNTPDDELLLDVDQPLTDEVDLYVSNDDGTWHHQAAGDFLPFSQRKYQFSSFLMEVPVKHGAQVHCYLRVKNHEQQQVPVYIGTPVQQINRAAGNDLLMAVYSGILLVMFFYNLFLYAGIKDRSYLYYVIYILMIGLAQITLKGFAFKTLWGNNIWLQNHATYIFSSLVGIIVFVFIKNFLNTRVIVPKLTRMMDIIIAGYILCIPVALAGYYIVGYYMLQLFAMVAAFVTIAAAFIAIRKGVASARYFMFAWIAFIIGITGFVLKDYNIIPYDGFSTNTMPAGSAIELVLISFALANRINILKKEKEASQLQALEASRENERLISEQNRMLDQQVKERTRELENALNDLKRTEVELVNREKMSSLGLLTAGIAHEINNPINFVTASISPLKRDINDLLLLLTTYEDLSQKGLDAEALNIVKELKAKLDSDYLIEEIHQLLNGIEEGANRTANIVRGLQKFSRSDEHFMKSADLIDGIENTLTLLNNQIKDQIEIIKDYQPIPLIDCSPGKLNQVFLNILSNAIHAVNHNNRKEKVITVRAYYKDKNVFISFADNGQGMSKEVQEKIFDPFFTTKDVGKGTGLGLSISYGIIENHHGEILVNSTPGEGSEFIIRLPVEQNP